MEITHKVLDNGRIVGYIVENKVFINKYNAKLYLSKLENLSITSTGELRLTNSVIDMTYTSMMEQKYNILLKENPIERDIQIEFLKWKRVYSHKYILHLEGARQIGKTTELKKFAYRNYKHVIYVNLAHDAYKFQEIIKIYGVNYMGMNLYCMSANLLDYDDSSKTILIIDEVQTSSIIYNMLRDFKNNLKCHVVFTGSYLGAIINKEYFKSAGTNKNIKMTPISFREFLRVFDKHKLLDDISLYGRSDIKYYDELFTYYDLYKNIGGYPNAVMSYVKNISVVGVFSDLLDTFEKESSMYLHLEDDSYDTNTLFRYVFNEAAKTMSIDKKGIRNRITGDVINVISHNNRIIDRKNIRKAINWIHYSGLVNLSDLCIEGDIRDISPGARLYFNDCGLANFILKNSLMDVSNIDGIVTETFAYNELHRLCIKLEEDKLIYNRNPYFSTCGEYELDFIIVTKTMEIIGIEVKTTKGRRRSLEFFKNKKLIDRAVYAGKTYGGKTEELDTIPIFAIGARFPYN